MHSSNVVAPIKSRQFRLCYFAPQQLPLPGASPFAFADRSRIYLFPSGCRHQEVSVQADFDNTSASDDWVNLTTDISSVKELDSSFQETRREAAVYYEMYKKADPALVEARTSVKNLTTEVQQLRDSIQVLNTTQKNSMKESPECLEEIGSFGKLTAST